MSVKSKRSISDLPGQVSEEDAARMAGAGRDGKESGNRDRDAVTGISLGLESGPGPSSAQSAAEHKPSSDKMFDLPLDKLPLSKEALQKEFFAVYDRMQSGMNFPPSQKDIARLDDLHAKLQAFNNGHHGDSHQPGKIGTPGNPLDADKATKAGSQQDVDKIGKTGSQHDPDKGGKGAGKLSDRGSFETERPEVHAQKLAQLAADKLAQLRQDGKVGSGNADGYTATWAAKVREVALDRYNSAFGTATSQYVKSLAIAEEQYVKAREGADSNTSKAATEQYEKACKAAAEEHDRATKAAAKQFDHAIKLLEPYKKSDDRDRAKSESVPKAPKVDDRGRANSEPALQVSRALPVDEAPKLKGLLDKVKDSGREIQKEITKNAGPEITRTVTSIAQSAVADIAKDAAKKAGTYNETTVTKKVVAKTSTTTDGNTTTEVTKGSHSTTTEKVYSYSSKVAGTAARGGGAELTIGAGLTDKTTITTDRDSVQHVKQTWSDLNVKAYGSSSYDANMVGVTAQVGGGASAGGEVGIKVTVTDKTTGAAQVFTGVLKREALIDGTATGTINWTRAMVKAGGAAENAVSGRVNYESTDAAGRGWGVGGSGKLGVGAFASGETGLSFNPAEGFGFKRGGQLGVEAGGRVGGTTKVSTDVTKAEAGGDLLIGNFSAKLITDGTYKDGKIHLKLELGAAVALGFSVKLDTEIDVKRWGENIEYRAEKAIKQFKDGTPLEQAWAVAKVVNPYLRAYEIASTLFGESKPLDKVTVHWDPTNKSRSEIAAHYVEEIKQFAKVRENILLSYNHAKSFNNTDTTFNQKFQWEGRTTLDYFRFDHPKNLSDNIARGFGESQDPRIKNLELTFRHSLPDYMASSFKFTPDPKDPAKLTLDLKQGAGVIFSGQLSLVQYMSIQEHVRVAQMDKDTAESYLRTNSALSEHLPGEAKAKLWAFWQDLQKHKEVPPYGTSAHAEHDVRFENLFWWEAKRAAEKGTPEETRISEFDHVARAMTQAYNAKDDQIAPRTVIGNAELFKWTTVPRGEDGLRLIDLSEVKAGKIGLKDLLYQNEMKVLSKLPTPEAVYRYMMSSESAHIAEGSKGHFMQEWMSKYQNASWSTGTDEASQRAQVWWTEHSADYWKMVATGKVWETPLKAPNADLRW
jgi:hypothetical protein